MIIETEQDLITQIKWTPKSYVGRFDKEWVYYEKNWFCKENSIIHNNLKQVINCKYCCSLDKQKALKIYENNKN